MRHIIEKNEHINVENIVAMDVEYGGGRTVPRVSVVDFNENTLYYSDFCLRYEDWIETKLTEAADDQAMHAKYIDDNINYSEKQPMIEVVPNKEEEAMLS